MRLAGIFQQTEIIRKQTIVVCSCMKSRRFPINGCFYSQSNNIMHLLQQHYADNVTTAVFIDVATRAKPYQLWTVSILSFAQNGLRSVGVSFMYILIVIHRSLQTCFGLNIAELKNTDLNITESMWLHLLKNVCGTRKQSILWVVENNACTYAAMGNGTNLLNNFSARY